MEEPTLQFEAAPVAPEKPDARAGVDQDLLAIFLEEAGEVLEGVEQVPAQAGEVGAAGEVGLGVIDGDREFNRFWAAAYEHDGAAHRRRDGDLVYLVDQDRRHASIGHL